MDCLLLWLPYPAMLINRGICGFLGINSAMVRASSIHQYIPEQYRARVNAFSEAAICVAGSISALLIGVLGEIMDYRMPMTITAMFCILACWLTVGKNQEALNKIYLYLKESTKDTPQACADMGACGVLYNRKTVGKKNPLNY